MGNQWLLFALMTVVSWGVYGILLHKGQVYMNDAVNGRYKAFLFVGVAYFVVAILGPLIVLKMNGAKISGFTGAGMSWSFIAGVAGAIGAFTTLLALGAAANMKGAAPAMVMSIVFAGAPVVNTVVGITLDKMAGAKYTIPLPFFLGIVLAAAGGFLVVKYKPVVPAAAKPAAKAAAVSAVAPGYVDVTTRTYHVS